MTPPVEKLNLTVTVEKVAAVGAPPSDGAREALSFEEIYAHWFHDVSRWVRALGGMNADLDDLTQEVFLVVRRKLSQFDGRNLASPVPVHAGGPASGCDPPSGPAPPSGTVPLPESGRDASAVAPPEE